MNRPKGRFIENYNDNDDDDDDDIKIMMTMMIIIIMIVIQMMIMVMMIIIMITMTMMIIICNMEIFIRQKQLFGLESFVYSFYQTARLPNCTPSLDFTLGRCFV